MIISPAGDHSVALVDEFPGHGLGVGDHLLGIILKFRFQGLLESNSFGGGDMIVRTSLHAWKYCLINLFGIVLFAHNNSSSRSSQSFMSGSGHDIKNGDRVSHLASGY